jgi:hypothetical protein
MALGWPWVALPGVLGQLLGSHRPDALRRAPRVLPPGNHETHVTHATRPVTLPVTRHVSRFPSAIPQGSWRRDSNLSGGNGLGPFRKEEPFPFGLRYRPAVVSCTMI